MTFHYQVIPRQIQRARRCNYLGATVKKYQEGWSTRGGRIMHWGGARVVQKLFKDVCLILITTTSRRNINRHHRPGKGGYINFSKKLIAAAKISWLSSPLVGWTADLLKNQSLILSPLKDLKSLMLCSSLKFLSKERNLIWVFIRLMRHRLNNHLKILYLMNHQFHIISSIYLTNLDVSFCRMKMLYHMMMPMLEIWSDAWKV